MRRAFAGLRCRPGYVLTDGLPGPRPGRARPGRLEGRPGHASVAAASVVAKVSRDRMMRTCTNVIPWYGFDRHKGYNTDEHERALTEHGPSPVHRYSFVNVNRVAVQARPRIARTMDLMDPIGTPLVGWMPRGRRGPGS